MLASTCTVHNLNCIYFILAMKKSMSNERLESSAVALNFDDIKRGWLKV